MTIICDEVLLKEETGYYNSYRLINRKSGREFSNLLEINVLDLEKVPVRGDGGKLYRWAEFFKAKGREEYRMLAEKVKEPGIKEAAMKVLELNEDERLRLLAEARDKWMWDHTSRMRASFAEGTAKAKAEDARKMKSKGYPVEDIQDITGLSPEEIEKL
jgi:predicted transposase/invertase (TIGR01784 family)